MSERGKARQGRLWVRVLRGHRSVKDVTVPCARTAPLDALREAMRQADLSMPVWLPKHQADWEKFALARLKPEHFLESVDFDSVELSYIAPEGERKPAGQAAYEP